MRRYGYWVLVIASASPFQGLPRRLSLPAARVARGGASLTVAPAGFALNPVPEVKILFSGAAPSTWAGDLLVFPLFAPSKKADSSKVAALTAEATAADAFDGADGAFGGAVAELVASAQFNGGAGKHASVRLQGGARVRTVAVAGLGRNDRPSAGSSLVPGLRAVGRAVAALARAHRTTRSIGVVLPADSLNGATDAARAGGAVAGSLMEALYADNRYRTGENAVSAAPHLASITFLSSSFSSSVDPSAEGYPSPESALAAGEALAVSKAVSLAKDLVNAPANFLNPRTLAEAAKAVAVQHDCLRCKVLEKDDVKGLGMGAFLGVAQGAQPGDGSPRLIHLTYTPPLGTSAAVRRLCLVGKGVTFDSGGYNLKGAEGMRRMKKDMAGAAAVLACADACGSIRPQGVEVHFIVAACENMVSDKAMRPGDVLTASNGKTIEVVNTDAEGRLTLADALVYAEKLQPFAIVDVATLTGACVAALGDKVAGLWSGDEGLVQSLLAASSSSGDRAWRMPLAAAEYKELTRSKVADLTNCGPKGSPGAITAALFLTEFVTERTPWAHIDMAGPVWADKSGATGFGVKLLVDFVRAQGAAASSASQGALIAA